MADTGLAPAPASSIADIDASTPSSQAVPVSEAPAVAATEPSAELVPPELDVTPPAAPDEQAVSATLGLLRAEPDGSVVIAGSGEPGAKVEIFLGDALIGTADVEPSGDWVVVPDEPLPPGGAEITLGEAGKAGRADRSFVVAINEDRNSEPLVVASTLGQASEILQGVEPAAAPIAAQPTAPEPVQSPAPTAPKVTPLPPISAAVPPAAVPENPAPGDAGEVEAVADAQSPAPDATSESENAAASQADAAPAPPAPIPAPDEEKAEPISAPSTPAPAVVPERPRPAEPSAPAPAPEAPPGAAALDDTRPSIDAIEVEPGRTFFAGGGPDGATMRLYVDDKFVADAEVTGGRWLVEAGDVLTEPSQRVRIDMLVPGSAAVVGRSEVNFVIDLPEGEAPIATAEAETTPSPSVQPPPAASPEPEEAGAASAQSLAEDTTPTGQAPEGSSLPAIAESPVTLASPPPATASTDSQPDPAAPVSESPLPAPQPPAPISRKPPSWADQAGQVAERSPTAPEASAPSVDVAPAVAPAPPVAQAETALPAPSQSPASPPAAQADAAPPSGALPSSEVPTMVAASVGEPDAQRFASGKAIIRGGDNLWTIAKRVYGLGIEYTTIYRANTGQIRDPNQIYPGQVFDLPESAAN